MIAPNDPRIADEIHLVAPPGAAHTHGVQGRLIPTLLCASHAPTHGAVIAIGDAAARRNAQSLGLDADEWVHPTAARGRGTARAIGSMFPSATRVVCWNDELAPLAASLGLACEIVSTKPTRAPDKLPKRCAVRVRSVEDQVAWINKGTDAAMDRSLEIPTIDDPALGRTELRDSLGISPGTLCLGAFEDDATRVDARQFAFLLGLLSVAGYDVVGALPEDASRRAQAVRHHNALGRPFRMLWTSSPLTDVLPALDACVISPGVRDGSTELLEQLLESSGVTPIDLSTSGRRGFSRSQRIAAKILDRIDGVVSKLASDSEILSRA